MPPDAPARKASPPANAAERREPVSAQRPRRSLGALWDTFGILGVLLALLASAPLVAPGFLTLENLQLVLRGNAFLGIVAVGMTLLIASGAFDLSVGGQLAVVSILTIFAFNAFGLVPALLVAVLAGAVTGAVNGLIVVRLRVPAFVATLGTLFLFRGVGYLLTGDRPATIPYSSVGSGFTQIGSLDLSVFPLPFVIMVGCFAAAWVFLRRTATGRQLLAVGSSETAARFCGIDVGRIRIGSFVLVGVSVGLASITYASRIFTADGNTQDGFELNVIAAVVLGGTTLRGGRATLIGTFSAVLLVAVLNDLLVFRGIDQSLQRVVLGLVLLAALAIDGLRARFAAPGSLRRALHLAPRVAPSPHRPAPTP